MHGNRTRSVRFAASASESHALNSSKITAINLGMESAFIAAALMGHRKENQMKSKLLFVRSAAECVLAAVIFPAAMLAQAPPPPPPQQPGVLGSSVSVSGAISQLNYGPEMEVTSFLVSGNTLVTFPPHVGCTIGSVLKSGENVQVTGYGSTTPAGMQRIELVSLSAEGRTFSVPRPGQFTSYNGSATVRQLNYNREGDIDGFLLSNRVFAKTPPPFSATLTSMISVGSQVSITGYAHPAMNGWTIVDVQSINGQTVAPGPVGPPPGPR